MNFRRKALTLAFAVASIGTTGALAGGTQGHAQTKFDTDTRIMGRVPETLPSHQGAVQAGATHDANVAGTPSGAQVQGTQTKFDNDTRIMGRVPETLPPNRGAGAAAGATHGTNGGSTATGAFARGERTNFDTDTRIMGDVPRTLPPNQSAGAQAGLPSGTTASAGVDAGSVSPGQAQGAQTSFDNDTRIMGRVPETLPPNVEPRSERIMTYDEYRAGSQQGAQTWFDTDTRIMGREPETLPPNVDVQRRPAGDAPRPRFDNDVKAMGEPVPGTPSTGRAVTRP